MVHRRGGVQSFSELVFRATERRSECKKWFRMVFFNRSTENN
ncbi:hypothetical protein LINGRAPRIM_LOCUS110 [Linum grandiflorum]